ncbi:hypothetical protein PR001_g29295 [Phytophthora rubi]|uniref:Uncharacterized protein n=1 Tax=Phytophthora rubi TaxID=129364 RepID=A0A6A3H2C0_9STRA|nr:hypothetical protein PR001_g29295 [Phytophthora rubi]
MLTTDNAALDLLAEVDAELQEQADEETTNVFVSVKELREFTKTIDELQVVFLTVIMCVLAVKRLANNRGTRLTCGVGNVKFCGTHWYKVPKQLRITGRLWQLGWKVQSTIRIVQHPDHPSSGSG